MASVPLSHGLILAGILFLLGFCGVLVRRNIIFILFCIEIMLNAAGLAFIVAGSNWQSADGQVMFIFILSIEIMLQCLRPGFCGGRFRIKTAGRSGDVHLYPVYGRGRSFRRIGAGASAISRHADVGRRRGQCPAGVICLNFCG